MARKTETRDVRGFTRIALMGWGEVDLEQCSGDGVSESVVVEADQELLPRLSIEVRGGQLRLGLDMDWWEWLLFWFEWIWIADKRVHYRVTARQVEGLSISGAGSMACPSLKTGGLRLQVSGAGKIRMGGMQAESVRTDISGSGDVELSGAAPRHEVRISGSGSVKALDLDTRDTAVHISGSGSARVRASQTLEVNISGAGDVRYAGQPQVRQRISGAGRVTQA